MIFSRVSSECLVNGLYGALNGALNGAFYGIYNLISINNLIEFYNDFSRFNKKLL